MSVTSERARFLAKVAFTEECWLWLGKPKESGYGRFHFAGRTEYAHRASYRLFVGPIPAGLTLDHLCRTPLCVNPDHLEAVTMRENLLRGTGPSAANARKERCKHGHPFTHVNSRGERVCRTCLRAAGRRHDAKRAVRA